MEGVGHTSYGEARCATFSLAMVSDLYAQMQTFECDTEPYAQQRDAAIRKQAESNDVDLIVEQGHTLHDMEHLEGIAKGKPPRAYNKFLSLLKQAGKVPDAKAAPSASDIPPISSCSGLDESLHCASLPSASAEGHAAGSGNFEKSSWLYGVPSLAQLGYPSPTVATSRFPGGESEGLRRLARHMGRKEWVAAFKKPDTQPTSLEPDTTGLSPYLKFGCVSVRDMYHQLQEVYAAASSHSSPPQSLEGQLLWREFFYFQGFTTENYDTMKGNGVSKQIPWDQSDKLISAWENSQTGYPWIDAAMTQLREEGWLHHLARHAVACFLTRGDLYQNWEAGAKVFDKYLLDSDWALNNGNWMWLSASAYFHQFFRVYSPVAFPKKTDKNGDYIRKWLPQFKNFPAKYIYEPWKAPASVQQQHGVVVGDSYPERVVVHEDVSKRNISRHSDAYKAHKAGHTGGIPDSISGIGATQVASLAPAAQMQPGKGTTAFHASTDPDSGAAAVGSGASQPGTKRARSPSASGSDAAETSSKQARSGSGSETGSILSVSDDSE